MAELITLETGKPIHFARAEVSQSADMADAILAIGQKWNRQRKRSGNQSIRDCSLGVVAPITPWNHPQVSAVTLTGSNDAGFVAMEICGRRYLPLQAELGGNNASIVWRDADRELAASQIAVEAFEMAGQRCTANRCVILHRDIVDAFLVQLAILLAGGVVVVLHPGELWIAWGTL